MSSLADLLSSKAKAELSRRLFGVRAERLHLRELARHSGLAVGTVRQELDRLARLGLVQSEADANRTSTSICSRWSSSSGSRRSATKSFQRCWPHPDCSSSETIRLCQNCN